MNKEKIIDKIREQLNTWDRVDIDEDEEWPLWSIDEEYIRINIKEVLKNYVIIDKEKIQQLIDKYKAEIKYDRDMRDEYQAWKRTSLKNFISDLKSLL